MGQKSSCPKKENKMPAEEKDSEIWSSVIHITDRDVLVQNIGRNKREKVKLNEGRKHSKLDNIHLADIRRLEGVPVVKKRSTSGWLWREHSSRVGYPTGVVNHACAVGSDGRHKDGVKTSC